MTVEERLANINHILYEIRMYARLEPIDHEKASLLELHDALIKLVDMKDWYAEITPIQVVEFILNEYIEMRKKLNATKSAEVKNNEC